MDLLAAVKKTLQSKSKEETLEDIDRAMSSGPKKLLIHASRIAKELSTTTTLHYRYKIDCSTLEDYYVINLLILHLKRYGYIVEFCNGEICIIIDSQQRTKLTD